MHPPMIANPHLRGRHSKKELQSNDSHLGVQICRLIRPARYSKLSMRLLFILIPILMTLEVAKAAELSSSSTATMVVGITITNACDVSGPAHHTRFRGKPVVSCRFQQPFKVTAQSAETEREDGAPLTRQGPTQRASTKLWMIEF